MKKLLLFSSFILFSFLLFAQKAATVRKFGKVTPEELQKKVYTLDSNANSVVIYDFGKSEIVGNSKGWFSLEFTHHKIVHILKKGGYEMGDVEVPLYVDGNAEEKLISVKAVTYNLENNALTVAIFSFINMKRMIPLCDKYITKEFRNGQLVFAP